MTSGTVRREGSYGEEENSLGWLSSLCIPRSSFARGDAGAAMGWGLLRGWRGLDGRRWHWAMPNGTSRVTSIFGVLGWRAGMLWGHTPRSQAPGRTGEVGEGWLREAAAEGIGEEDKVPPALRTANKYQG